MEFRTERISNKVWGNNPVYEVFAMQEECDLDS